MDSELAQQPPRASRRDARAAEQGAAGRTGSAGPRRLPIPQLAVGAVGLIGLLLLIAGALQATVFAPPVTVAASLVSPRQPVVSTAVGVLGLEGPRVRVEAGASASQEVFVGIGRAADVDAYLAKVARQEIVGWDGGHGLTARRLGTESTLPDPAGADVWVVSSRARGSASLAWPDAPGQWRLVAATDGTGPAPTVSFTWSGRSVHTAAAPLIAIGTVLIVAGVITLLMLSSRSRLDEQEPEHVGDPA